MYLNSAYWSPCCSSIFCPSPTSQHCSYLSYFSFQPSFSLEKSYYFQPAGEPLCPALFTSIVKLVGDSFCWARTVISFFFSIVTGLENQMELKKSTSVDFIPLHCKIQAKTICSQVCKNLLGLGLSLLLSSVVLS